MSDNLRTEPSIDNYPKTVSIRCTLPLRHRPRDVAALDHSRRLPAAGKEFDYAFVQARTAFGQYHLLLTLAGTVIVALQKSDLSSGREHLTGNLLMLCAAFAWAGGTVYSRPLLKCISPMQLSGSAALIALPVHLLLATGRCADSASELQSVNLWLIILYAGTLSSGVALPMWNFGVRHAGAAHAAIIHNPIPLIAIAAAWFSRGESATTAQLFGGTLILGGLVIMRFARQTHYD